MKRERITSTSDRQRFFSGRPAELLRATAVHLTFVATIFGCSVNATAGDHEKATPVATANPQAHKVSAATRIRNWFQTGQASWYGLKFQGRKTATGETYDMNALTCAHPSLPLGSWVRVTNLRNRKTVLVRVNDRGPSFGDRIVDLSYAAARAVGLRDTGKVKLERVSLTDPELAKVLIARLPDATLPNLLSGHPDWLPAQ
jgi:rare lipoprotein A